MTVLPSLMVDWTPLTASKLPPTVRLLAERKTEAPSVLENSPPMTAVLPPRKKLLPSYAPFWKFPPNPEGAITQTQTGAKVATRIIASDAEQAPTVYVCI